ncbi:hypothetical protein [Hyunsoonleella rubra]|uniref:hypothetical protein n=1 Tax=Hyunsoonleella rubra TaxID=1737062 RepID=UPI0036D31144
MILLSESCKKSRDGSAVVLNFQTEDTSFGTDNFSICNDKMYLYFLIGDIGVQEKIFDGAKIEKIILNHNGADYVALPNWVMSSSLPDSYLSFITDNNSNEVFYENERGKWLILVEMW